MASVPAVADKPSTSAHLIDTFDVPVAVGVPEISPVVPFNVIPAGSVPLTKE